MHNETSGGEYFRHLSLLCFFQSCYTNWILMLNAWYCTETISCFALSRKKSVSYFIIHRSMFSPEIISHNVSENARLPKLRFKDAVEGFEFAMNDRLIDFLEYNQFSTNLYLNDWLLLLTLTINWLYKEADLCQKSEPIVSFEIVVTLITPCWTLSRRMSLSTFSTIVFLTSMFSGSPWPVLSVWLGFVLL